MRLRWKGISCILGTGWRHSHRWWRYLVHRITAIYIIIRELCLYMRMSRFRWSSLTIRSIRLCCLIIWICLRGACLFLHQKSHRFCYQWSGKVKKCVKKRKNKRKWLLKGILLFLSKRRYRMLDRNEVPSNCLPSSAKNSSEKNPTTPTSLWASHSKPP